MRNKEVSISRHCKHRTCSNKPDAVLVLVPAYRRQSGKGSHGVQNHSVERKPAKRSGNEGRGKNRVIRHECTMKAGTSTDMSEVSSSPLIQNAFNLREPLGCPITDHGKSFVTLGTLESKSEVG
jgi:hypothetical protein